MLEDLICNDLTTQTCHTLTESQESFHTAYGTQLNIPYMYADNEFLVIS